MESQVYKRIKIFQIRKHCKNSGLNWLLD